MQRIDYRFISGRCPKWLLPFLLVGLTLTLGMGPALAQGDGPVQELTGRIEPGEIVLYRLPDLQAGQTLYVRVDGISGNLDPIMGVVETDADPAALEMSAETALDEAVAGGLDPLEALDQVRDEFTLAWDDDSGGGLSAALEFEVPTDGDYRLLVTGALAVAGGQTFGEYHLLIGLDVPDVLAGGETPNGETMSTGDTIAVLDAEATPLGAGVQEVSGSLTPEKRSTFVELQGLRPGDTLYAFVEATSGDLAPIIELQNFARKPIRVGNLGGSEPRASLQYTFPEAAQNYRLEITSCCGDERVTSGDYRLLVGINVPEVMAGQAEPDGRVVIRAPVEVQVGMRVEQIIDVVSQQEFFTAVSSLQMEWADPTLAFSPDTCQCVLKTYTQETFSQFLDEFGGRWPAFSLQNQQGNRWIQNRDLVVFADGRASYFERFTTDFQVDFDFRQYPFDTQQFVIRVDALYPEEYYHYADLEGFTEISPEHGEDEYALTDFQTSITSEKTRGGPTTSRFTFSFEAPRHLGYYILRVFVPILLIIVVSWVTFFLRDYGRRIEVASANLLLFIAFSWSLAEDFPRLGYLTFLDSVMVIMFIVNAFVIVYNVFLRRLEMQDKADLAERIDNVLDWVYPLTYVVSFGVVILWFFVFGLG